MEGDPRRIGALSRALRALRRIALWGALTLLALIAVAFGINAFDERPSPETSALSQPPQNPYKPEENIYVALAGFDAPPGQSVFAKGQATIVRYNERADTMLHDPLFGLESFAKPDPDGLKFQGTTDTCSAWKPSYWACVHENRAKIEQLVDQNRELYERYLALFALPGYCETARPGPATPIYLAPTEVRNLFLANVSLSLQAGDNAQTEAALNSLRQDAELWRRVLTGNGTLISKMVAIALLQKDSLVLSDVIADPRAVIPQNMDAFLPEFAPSDWDISNAFAAEFRVHLFMYRQVQALSEDHWQPPDATGAARMWNRLLSPIEGHFFKINATKNLNAKLMTELARGAALDPSTFSTKQARLREFEQADADFMSLKTVYNPIGKILVAIAAPAYNDYVLRPYDAAALQRLVRLSFEIRRRQIAPSAVPEFMKLHPEWSTHPADGRPFVWKPSTGEIAIQPVARQPEDRRFSVKIWQPAQG